MKTAELTRRDIPTVFMDTGANSLRSSNIIIDYGRGIQEALQHLFSLNHRRIAFISGPLNLQSAQRRLDAFIGGMKSRGIDVGTDLIEKCEHLIEGGISAIRNLFHLRVRP